MRHLVLPSILIISLAPTALPAQAKCCCCGRSPLVREDLRGSDVVWVVRVEFANQDPKSEERDLTIVDALKEHPKLANKHIVRYAGAIPIPDPKKPPNYLVLGNLLKGDAEIYRGYEATPDMLAYVTGLLRFHPMDHRQTLALLLGLP